jgi:hypothetical protein
LGFFLMHTDTEHPQQIGAIVARIVERASRLDRRADAELFEGRHTVAERLANLAAELRLEVTQ